MTFKAGTTLGIDLGIGSCGWALIADDDEGRGRIIALGVRTFDVPETAKERTPTNQLRRGHRGLRRVTRRRAGRMADIRELFRIEGLIASAARNALWIKSPAKPERLLDPWTLRAEGLDRLLQPEELAVALGHIAKHRGFKSNRKSDGGNAPNDSSKMLNEIAVTQGKMNEYRSVGEMFARSDDFARRKRNRDGDFTRSILRSDQEAEVRKLFDAQRRLQSNIATRELEQRFTELAFFQRPLRDSADKVGDCIFEPAEKRSPKLGYSFELFRFLSRLNHLRIFRGRETRMLTPDDIVAASADFGAQQGMTFKRLRKLIHLDDDERFDAVRLEEEDERDVVNRKKSNLCMRGTATLRKKLGEAAWQSLLRTPEKLDGVAAVLSFREEIGAIRDGLSTLDLDALVLETLMEAAKAGAFADFKKAGHISAKAARNINPHLAKGGLTYDKACAAAGYRHSLRPATELEDIANPIARKALTEAVKQVKAIVQKYGLPERIHVELARDVGKSKDERDEIKFGIEKRNKEKEKLRDEFRSVVGCDPRGGEDMLRYELWKEQNGRCLYTDKSIPPSAIVASDNSVQVDHILPWSKSGEDGFDNKTLCFISANQEKKGRTPFDWLKDDEARWLAFASRIEALHWRKDRKRRNYLLKDSTILEDKFRPRNLNDTRFACRALLDLVARLYPGGDTPDEAGTRRHVFARPGFLTARLRHGWGVERLKKDKDGKRVDDDRHHALDALVCAATSESALQKLIKAFQERERLGLPRDFSRLDPPWPDFLEETRTKLREVFVSRAERRRARGEAHAATIRQVKERDGRQIVYERKSIEKLKREDLLKIKDAQRNGALVEILRDWLDAGSPKARPPVWKYRNADGSERLEPIRKVRLETDKKPAIDIRGGAADRGEMVRVDVFRKQNRRGALEFFLVPIYPHQVADSVNWPTPPNRAVQAYKPESDWPEMSDSYQFAWSLYPASLIEIEKPDGTFVDGYFRGLDRTTGAIAVSMHCNNSVLTRGVGARTLRSLKKLVVDRLGNQAEVSRETRTWRGKACT